MNRTSATSGKASSIRNHRLSTPTIYGRDRESAQLREELADTIAGRGSLILLSGEAGIGKTALIDDLAYEAEQRNCLVLTGNCYDLTTTPPYGPWIEITRRYPEQDELPPLPGQLRAGGEMEDIPSQEALFDLASTFVVEIAGRQPLVLLLEDLHWSDAESLALLRHISRAVRDHRILIVASYRDDEITRHDPLAQLLPRLIRESRARRINLHPLDAAAIEAMIRGRYTLTLADEARLRVYLRERSDGNPLYAEELLFTLEAEGTLVDRGDGHWALNELEAVPVPMLVVQLIEDRLGRLESCTRELLEILALIGHEVEIDLWRRVAETDDAELIETTRQAIEGRIIIESAGGTRLQFRHALIREALTSGLVALERQRWHRRIADILIEGPDPDPDAVVTHLERADDPRLIEWLVKAGERAKERLAWDVAVERYNRAVQIAGPRRESDPKLVCDLLLALGTAQQIAGSGRGNMPGSIGGGSSGEAYWAALQAARETGSPSRIARAVVEVTQGIFGIPYVDQQVVGLLEETLAQIPDEDSSELAMIQAHLASAYRNFKMFSGIRFETGTEDAIERLSAEALTAADNVGTPSIMKAVRDVRAWVITHPGRVDERRALVEELRSMMVSAQPEITNGVSTDVLSTQIPRRPNQLRIVHLAFLDEMARGDIARGRQLIDELTRHEQRLQTPHAAWIVGIHQAGLALSEGRYDTAETLLQEADAVWPNTGAVFNQIFALRREDGRLSEVEPQLSAILQRFPNSPWYRLCWILYLLETGDEQRARQLFNGIDIHDLADLARGDFWSHAMALCAELSVMFEDENRAHACYELLKAYPDHIVYCGYIYYCAGSISYYLGLLAGFLEEWEAAEGHFTKALEQHQAMGFHPLVAYTRLEWARMVLQRGEAGDREGAGDLLDQALETGRSLGMVRLERLASELAADIRPATAGASPAGLSPRETEVIELVVAGLSNPEIGERLYISPRTVSQHLRSVFNKLDVNNRAAAVARWVELSRD